jgi:hypothetical protein
MEQKSAVIFETKKGEKGERVYQLLIPVGAPFGEVFDVVFEMLASAESLSKQALENAKKAIDEARAKEVVEPEAQEVTATLN